ncbi:MAG TPA: sigma-70 family RNA polymerase sigma factor [Kofleriaceae bacterium]
MDDDLSLLSQWRDGDKHSGQALFSRHFPAVYRFFEHKVGGEADELVQRTFTACVVSREQFRAESTFRTYLFAIARKQLYSHLRTLARRDQVDFEATSIAEIVTSVPGRIGKLQLIERLRTALARLPAEQQLLLELHYWQELDASALAEIFDIPAGTVRVRLLRARKALRAQLGDLGEDPLPSAGNDRLIEVLSHPPSEDQA